MPLVDQLALHKLKLQSRHVFSPLDANYGAIGDGSDEAAKIQACIDEAESVPNSVVLLNPPVTFGMGTTLLIGQGTYPITIQGLTGSVYEPLNPTITKTADVVAWKVVDGLPTMVRPIIRGVSVRGRGHASDPSLTDTEVESTPGALIHSRCEFDHLHFARCGGLADIGEAETTGYAFGIIQLLAGSNCNAIHGRVGFQTVTGDGLYIHNVSGSNVNTNIIRIDIPRVFGLHGGYAVNNASGMRNEFRIGTFDKSGGTPLGVFRLDYVDCYGWLGYAEGGTPLLVDFGANGGKNYVEVKDSSVFTAITNGTLRNNTVRDLRGAEWIGNATGSHQRGFYGTGGVEFDRLALPNPAADGYVAVTEAAYADYGTAFGLASSAAQGTVTWTTRVAECRKVGAQVTFDVRLEGSVNVASANASRLTTDSATTGMTFVNGSNRGGPGGGPLYLTNSAVTGKPVNLKWVSNTNWTFVDGAGAAMTFNDVVGAGAFTIDGRIECTDNQGMA